MSSPANGQTMIATAIGRLREWTFCSGALGHARAQVLEWKGARARAARQAKLLVEVARGVAEPAEVLPDGSRPAVLLQLYREAVYWGLFAVGPEGDTRPRNLNALWAESRPESLLTGVEPEALEAVRRSLADERSGSLDVTEEEAKRVRGVAEALADVMDAPRRRVRRLLMRRWSTAAMLVVLLVASGFVLRALLRPNLIAGRGFQTSSRWAGCPSDPNCVGLMFCTDPEANPWVEFDLERPRAVHSIDITNRIDCCADRAVPLLVETSIDRTTWTEVGRRDRDFKTWAADLQPSRARYVRLRVPRSTVFHLQDIAIH